jgi:hypothetical protein
MLLPMIANGQLGRPSAFNRDTNFVKSYDREITARLYLSQKYTSILMPGTSSVPAFRYRPNTTLNLGVGATYRSFSLNLAYGFSGLNQGAERRGDTRYLDLQAHLYAPQVVIDLFGQFYNGYYITPLDFVPNFSGYYLRPDMRVRLIGGSAYYVFNRNKFSYRAALIQNEWQTRSAGTLLVGAEAYYGNLSSDALLVPLELAALYPQGEVRRLRFFNIGPGIGYAYTYVYRKHWFATGSLTINVPLDFVQETSLAETRNKTTITPNFLYRLAIGYNSRRWICTASLVNGTVTANGSFNDNSYRISTGNYRLTLAHRFDVTRKINKVLKPVDNLLREGP